MLAFLIILICATSNSYATPSCHELHKSQLASLSERMNQMLSSLYSPLASKAETTSNTTPPEPTNIHTAAASESPTIPHSTYYPYPYSIPAPQIIYVSPSQYPQPTLVPYTPPNVEPSLKPYKNLYYPQVAQPFDFSPGPMDAPTPWTNYFDHYPYPQYPTPTQQYSMPTPYMPYPSQPLPYPPPYPYPEYPKVPSYPPVPSLPAYQPPPQVYPPPSTPYPFPPPYYG